MLVLSREVDEQIIVQVGEVQVVVRVLGFHRDAVRLGFSAPENVSIDREEIYDAKHRTKERGTTPSQ